MLLAAILEKSATNNLMDDEDLAMYLGCTNIEFIRYHKKLRDMDKAGIIQIGGGRGGRRCYRVSPETLKAVESNGEFNPVKMSGLMTEELFFNEADAVFTKRIENVEQSVDQMNNAIQNIILEEMESIEGILIATTNLLSNLDPAFERRFIFKVEFKMPEKDSRAKIWKSMIPTLSEEDASVLADKYAFSGGNIENIARKSTVEYVLSGNEPTLSSLEGYCQEEILDKKENRNRIGF